MGERFNIIYIDCPWQFTNVKTGGSMKSGAAHVYDGTLSFEDLKKLPIEKIAADNCVLFSWWLGTHAVEAIKCAKSWGFELKVMDVFVWRKLTVNGLDCFGMGGQTRKSVESCLVATKGKPRRVSKGVRQIYSSHEPEHSKKPDEFADRIVQLYGDLPRIEIFARDVKPGWKAIGNEVTGNDIRKDLYDLIGGDDREKLSKLKERLK